MLELIDSLGLDSALSQIEGMYAFSLWDRFTNELTLVRDKFGEKPLFYGFHGDYFLFGSSLNAMKSHIAFSPHINRNSCDLFLRFGYIPAPYTIYENTFKLKAGSKLVIAHNKHSKTFPEPLISSYAVPPLSQGLTNSITSSPSSIDDVENAIFKSVGERLQSDVPVGVLLSSGIDSTLIACMAQNHSAQPLDSFTVGFSDSNFDESNIASKTSDKLGMNHHILQLNPNSSLNLISKLPDVYGEPFADPSALPTLLLSQYVSQSVKVCLTGDGADELFAGYGRYYNSKPYDAWLCWNRLPTYLKCPLRNILQYLNHNPALIASSQLFDHSVLARLPSIIESLSSLTTANSLSDYARISNTRSGPSSLLGTSASVAYNSSIGHFPASGSSSLLSLLMQHDISFYLPDDILFKTDSSSMYFGLETRAPFLDSNVALEAARIHFGSDPNLKLQKNVLKKILLKYLPDFDISPTKKGFGIPLADWLRGPLRGWCYELLHSKHIDSFGIDRNWLFFIWNQHLQGTKNWAQSLWNIFMLLYWIECNV